MWAASFRSPDWIAPSMVAISGPAVMAGVVAAVAGLGQRVGPERQVRLSRQDLLDAALLGGVVEVVHPHGALVAHPAVLLEVAGPGHARNLGEEDAERGRLKTSAPVPENVLKGNSSLRTASGGTTPRQVLERWLAGIRQPVQLPISGQPPPGSHFDYRSVGPPPFSGGPMKPHLTSILEATVRRPRGGRQGRWPRWPPGRSSGRRGQRGPGSGCRRSPPTGPS